MTRKFNRTYRCSNCGSVNPAENRFSEWCRDRLLDSRDGLVISDCDYVAHRFMVHRDRAVQFILHVEVKTRMAELSQSQYDTLAIDHQAIRTHNGAGRRPNGRFVGNGGTKPIRVWSPLHNRHVWLNFLGWNTLRMSGETPQESDIVLWNNTRVECERVVKLLQLDIHPRSFKELTARPHKKVKRYPLLD